MTESGDGDELLTFYVEPASSLAIPPMASPDRRDNLWTRTCFEVFLRPTDSDVYWEFNLSPSSQWAAYAFDRYRVRAEEMAVNVPPHIEVVRYGKIFELDVDLDFSTIPNITMTMGISAVIEELDGTRSYWALAHPSGRPDFHYPACFVATLAAARAA